MSRAEALGARGGSRNAGWGMGGGRSIVLSSGSVKLKFILTRCDKHSRATKEQTYLTHISTHA